MSDEERRFTDPVSAVDHVRRLARETAADAGYQAAAAAVMDLAAGVPDHAAGTQGG